MVRLAREVTSHIVDGSGPDEMLRRLADPFWFQAFGWRARVHWHSSGVTTAITGALKEGIKDIQHQLGLFARGQGSDIATHAFGDRVALQLRSMDRWCMQAAVAAKVDNAAVHDGYQLYHHAFFFTRSGHWAVVQQGTSDATRTARRYHWLSKSLSSFVNKPHEAICSDVRVDTLNLVAAEHTVERTARPSRRPRPTAGQSTSCTARWQARTSTAVKRSRRSSASAPSPAQPSQRERSRTR